MPVVVVNPGVEHLGTLVGVLIDKAVGTFSQGGLNEAFGLAVGLGSIRFGEAVCKSEVLASSCKGVGMKRGPVVGE